MSIKSLFTAVFDITRGNSHLVTEEDTNAVQLDNADLFVTLHKLQKRGNRGELRRFAISCARSTLALEDPPEGWTSLVSFAESFLNGSATKRERKEMQNKYANVAMAASLVGLRNGCSNAAAFLAAYSTIRASASIAAAEAAHYTQLHSQLRTND